MDYDYGYVNGFIQKTPDNKCEGNLVIDGVDISPIEGVYFKDNGQTYLWLKRKPVLVYNDETMSFTTRKSKPSWEAYLEKSIENNAYVYVGTFLFMRFKYKIYGQWDKNLGKDKMRLNLFVERMSVKEQDIIRKIGLSKRDE